MKLLAAAAAFAIAAPAAAQITVDGTRDAAFGSATSSVLYNPAAPNSNFQAPTPFSDSVGYDIYLTSDANNVYGFLQARPDLGGAVPFTAANLYFDLQPSANTGSDLGFEITNSRAFLPGSPNAGIGGYSTTPLPGLSFAISGDGTGLEFSLANNLFTGPVSGLGGYGEYASLGSEVVLRLSQSFGYSVAGGPTFGPQRLGAVIIGGAQAPVPEPATWAMLIMGFGLVGGAMRRRRPSVAFA